MNNINENKLIDEIIGTRQLSLITKLIKKNTYLDEGQISKIVQLMDKDSPYTKEIMSYDLKIGSAIAVGSLFKEINGKIKSSLNGLIKPTKKEESGIYSSFSSIYIEKNTKIEYVFNEYRQFFSLYKEDPILIKEFKKSLNDQFEIFSSGMSDFNNTIKKKSFLTKSLEVSVINDLIGSVNLIKLLRDEEVLSNFPTLEKNYISNVIVSYIDKNENYFNTIIDYYLKKDGTSRYLDQKTNKEIIQSTTVRSVKDFFEMIKGLIKEEYDFFYSQSKLSEDEKEKYNEIQKNIEVCLQSKDYLSKEETDILILIKEKRLPELMESLRTMTEEEKNILIYNGQNAIYYSESILNNFSQIVGKIKSSLKINKIRDLTANVEYSENLKNNFK